MIAELRDTLDNLYTDSTIGKAPRTELSTDVARRSIASIHVLVSGCEKKDCISIRLLEDGRRVYNACWYRLLPVPVEENTGLSGFTEGSMKGSRPANSPNPFVVRRAPFMTFDAMKPIGSEVEYGETPLALRCQVAISANDQPGLKRYSIQLESKGRKIALTWNVRVYPAVVPRVGHRSFPVTNWFSYENIASRHGLKVWSEPYWLMLEKYARLMAHGRQNTFWVPLSVIFETKNGKPVLLRDRLRRIVALFSKAGLYYIEGGHVACRTGYKWTATTFDVITAKVRATSPEGYSLLVPICQQLMEEIEKNRWRGRWIQHATDEPTATNSMDYRILVGMLRKLMPGIPILDATMDPSLVGSVDIWCPQVQEYQKQRQAFETQRELGDKVWFYTCCFPGGPWLNRLLDQELVRPALFGWAAALFRLDGFLHWGLNHYRKDQDPFRKSVIENWGGGSDSLPAGDTHVIYPGSEGPWSSLRFEAQREGWEDYELLKMVRERNERKAMSIIRTAIRGFDDYVRNPAGLRAARHALLKASK